MICGFVSALFTMFVTHGIVGTSGVVYWIIGSCIALILKNKIYILINLKLWKYIIVFYKKIYVYF